MKVTAKTLPYQLCGMLLASIARAADWETTYPRRIPDSKWLQTKQSRCFGVDGTNLDEVLKTEPMSQDFGLADVFGVHFKGTEDFSARWPNYPKWIEIYVGINKPELHPITDDPVIRSNYRRGSDRLQSLAG